MTHTRILIPHYGGPDALHLVQEPLPTPRPNEARIKILTAGVSLPDLMMREGLHPETPRLPFTPGWDLVGVVDHLGPGVTGIEPRQRVAALPITGAYAQYLCLPARELIPVPTGLDPAEAVALILNYVTAYQMLHRSARVKAAQRALIHGAAGGVGSALVQLGRLADLQMYGTCSAQNAAAVSDLGATPIDYKNQDFVTEIQRLTAGEGVHAVFDGIGGTHIWRSRQTLRLGGRVIAYGLTGALQKGRSSSTRPHRRHRVRPLARFALYIAASHLLPGRKRVIPYSIQWLKRLKPQWFRQDLLTLFTLLEQHKIKPLMAHRLPLAEARRAHELLAQGGITGKIVLICNPDVTL